MGLKGIINHLFDDIKAILILFKKKPQSYEKPFRHISIVREEYNRVSVDDKNFFFYSFDFDDNSVDVFSQLICRLNDLSIILEIEKVSEVEAMKILKLALSTIQEKLVSFSSNKGLEANFLQRDIANKKRLSEILIREHVLFRRGGNLATTQHIDKHMLSLFNSITHTRILPIFFEEIRGLKAYLLGKIDKNSVLISNINNLSLDRLISSQVFKGIYLANIIESNIPIFMDVFANENAHMVILAKSGAGKSFLARNLLKRWVSDGVRVIVCDPEGDWSDLVERYCGESFTLNDWSFVDNVMRRENNINYFKDLAGLLINQFPQLSQYQYLLYSITDSEGFFKLIETVPDFNEIVKSYINITDDDEVDNTLKSDLIHCSIGSQSDLHISLYKMLSYYFSREVSDTMIIIDEAHRLLDDERIAKLIRQAVKQGRKHRIGLCVISQDVIDFTQSPWSKAIISNATIKILLKQEQIYIPVLKTIFPIEGYETFLLNAKIGEGVFICNEQICKVFFAG